MLFLFSSDIKGFSLLELLVVLVIVGFMAVLIPPRINGAMASTQAKATARDVISALRQARSTAIVRQKEFVFKVDLTHKTYAVDDHKIYKMPNKMQVGLLTARSEQISEHVGGIRFFPDGSSTGGRVRLSMENLTLFIDVNWLTGKVALLEDINPESMAIGYQLDGNL